MVAIRRDNCFDNNGLADRCNSSSTPRMVFFGVMSILFSQSQILDFDQIWWLSIVAFVMSFTYCSIGLSLDIAQTISTSSSYVLIQAISSFMLSSVCFALAEYMRIWITMPPACRIGSRYPRSSFRAPTPTTGAFKGSGMRIGRARDALPAGRSHGTPTFARAGDCSWQLPPHKCDWFPIMGSTVINTDAHGGFKGSLTGVSIGAGVSSTQKIWHTLQAFGDFQVMQKATRLSVATTTIFYMLCGCMGYAAFGDKAPDNLLTGFGFYEPFWLLDIAIVLHLVGASWVTPMLSPACRTGRRNNLLVYYCISPVLIITRATDQLATPGSSSRARMPRTGAVKGSGRCIGRAEAVPAGRSDGTSTLTRTGDCSLLPDTCDWFRIMGSAVISTPDKSCVISAAVMCMEAQYRRFNKKYEGANSWSLKVTPKVVQSLKDMCYERRAWHPFRGAPSVEGVLDVIRSLKKGIPTCHDSISLRLKSYVSFGQLSPRKITSMLRKKGPVIGVLYAGEESYLSSTVYRRNRFALGDRHAVVCTGYRKVNGELCLMIMDNLEREGPFRFVLHEAFEEFHVLTVDAC